MVKGKMDARRGDRVCVLYVMNEEEWCEDGNEGGKERKGRVSQNVNFQSLTDIQ